MELLVLERCRKLREIEEEKRREISRLLAQKTEALLSTHTLENYSFFGVFPLITRDNTLLWAIAKVPLIEKSSVHQPYCRNAEVKVIDPITFVPSAIRDQIAFLYFDIKGLDVYAVDIFTDPSKRRQGIGTFILRLLECVAIGFGAKRIIGELSPVDLPNREIQIAFYTKNGYTVLFHENNKESGWVEKKLSQ